MASSVFFAPIGVTALQIDIFLDFYMAAMYQSVALSVQVNRRCARFEVGKASVNFVAQDICWAHHFLAPNMQVTNLL